MLKKTMTYQDFDGNDVTEDFYFHLSKADLTEMNFGHKGGLEKAIRFMMQEEDSQKLYAVMKDVVLNSVGKKSQDGKRFIKNQEISDEFSQTNAYSDLIVSFFENANTLSDFLIGCLPADLANEAMVAMDKIKNEAIEEVKASPEITIARNPGKDL